ncbi:HD-GYP domain-containing protein [Marinobacter caseinilyticus]|uniref:HD-GYP domain-containing protein n=1 Tax=Marinobacter caseinilyticus TaxID=2692195 RepID=UPI0014078362|nr:HD domain-containing phosphohydrolase [Marinobacter caseinilyticus]
MSNLVRVAIGAVIVGKPLPWTVYDTAGNVLLRQGYVVNSEAQLEQLFERGLFYPHTPVRPDVPEPDAVEDSRIYNPFADYQGLLEALETTLGAIANRDETARQQLLDLALFIDRMCLQAQDACLALVHLYSVEPTASEQTLFYAILCQSTARELGLDDAQVLTLISAALTANLALLPFLDKLNNINKALTDQQRLVIHKHPILSANALKEAGIDDTHLLTIIQQHHEGPADTGYPAGLADEDIVPGARMLALAEHYTAMITRRAYRDRLPVPDALKTIKIDHRDRPEPSIFRALLTILTPFPPGTLVRLANNEVAVVTHRPVRNGGTRAHALIGPKGDLYSGGGFKRDCSLLEFSIRAFENTETLPSMDFGLLWGFG